MTTKEQPHHVLPELRYIVDLRDRKNKWKPIVGGFKTRERAVDYGNKYGTDGRWRVRDRMEHYRPEDLA